MDEDFTATPFGSPFSSPFLELEDIGQNASSLDIGGNSSCEEVYHSQKEAVDSVNLEHDWKNAVSRKVSFKDRLLYSDSPKGGFESFDIRKSFVPFKSESTPRQGRFSNAPSVKVPFVGDVTLSFVLNFDQPVARRCWLTTWCSDNPGSHIYGACQLCGAGIAMTTSSIGLRPGPDTQRAMWLHWISAHCKFVMFCSKDESDTEISADAGDRTVHRLEVQVKTKKAFVRPIEN